MKSHVGGLASAALLAREASRRCSADALQICDQALYSDQAIMYEGPISIKIFHI